MSDSRFRVDEATRAIDSLEEAMDLEGISKPLLLDRLATIQEDLAFIENYLESIDN